MHNAESQRVDYPELLHQTYQTALQKNEEVDRHWQNTAKEYETLESLLGDLPKNLTKDVMVPVAPRAIMPGKLVHTNEILVGLGQGYFLMRSAAQAVEICKRRNKVCIDMLEKLQKERELFVGRSQLPLQEGAFAGVNEIIEEYNEEEDARWRAEHRQREKEYHQKLAELREKEQTKIEDEESLWKRLDELELQEELEEELDRLHAYESEEEEEEEDEDEEEEENTENEEDSKPEQENVPNDFLPTICERDITKKNGLKQRSVEESSQQTTKRRVSFVDPKEHENETGVEERRNDDDDDDDDGEMTLRIEFKHSSYVPSKTEPVEHSPIQSPGDIYTYFKDQFLSQPKSILKKSSSYPLVNETSLMDNAKLGPDPGYVDDCENVDYVPLPHPIANEVVERDVTITEKIIQQTSERPISKFKALRQRKKR